MAIYLAINALSPAITQRVTQDLTDRVQQGWPSPSKHRLCFADDSSSSVVNVGDACIQASLKNSLLHFTQLIIFISLSVGCYYRSLCKLSDAAHVFYKLYVHTCCYRALSYIPDKTDPAGSRTSLRYWRISAGRRSADGCSTPVSTVSIGISVCAVNMTRLGCLYAPLFSW